MSVVIERIVKTYAKLIKNGMPLEEALEDMAEVVQEETILNIEQNDSYSGGNYETNT